MEYGINNKIKYTTLQIRSILVRGNKQKTTKMAPTWIPPGGMGNGIERTYSQGNFIYYLLQYQRTDILVLLGPYTGWNQDLTVYTKNLQIMWQKRDPWGDLSAPKATLDSSFLSSLSDLLNDSKWIIITNSQNHFKSTFGSAYFISKNNEIKLAKLTKRNQEKQAFLGILACFLCIQLNCTDISEYYNLW